MLRVRKPRTPGQTTPRWGRPLPPVLQRQPTRGMLTLRSCPSAERSNRKRRAAMWTLRAAEAGVCQVRPSRPCHRHRRWRRPLPALLSRTGQSVRALRAGAPYRNPPPGRRRRPMPPLLPHHHRRMRHLPRRARDSHNLAARTRVRSLLPARAAEPRRLRVLRASESAHRPQRPGRTHLRAVWRI